MSDTTRRTFLKQAGLCAAAATACTARSYAAISGANDRVRVGILGCGDRMRNGLMPALLQHGRELNFELVAVADTSARRRGEGARFAQREQGTCTVATVRSNDELYQRNDLDAVMIATGAGAHALHGTQAVRRGLDAYIETPIAHSMLAARALCASVQQSGRIVQIGTQRRSAAAYQQLCGRVRSGEVGDLLAVEIAQTLSDPWLVHRLDTLHWLTGYPCPRSVVINGGLYSERAGPRSWDSASAVLDYGPSDDAATGLRVCYSARRSETMVTDRETYHFADATLDLHNLQAQGKSSRAKSSWLGRSVGGESSTSAQIQTSAHVRNWMECIRTRRTPNAGIETGHEQTVALCMTNLALETGMRISPNSGKWNKKASTQSPERSLKALMLDGTASQIRLAAAR